MKFGILDIAALGIGCFAVIAFLLVAIRLIAIIAGCDFVKDDED